MNFSKLSIASVVIAGIFAGTSAYAASGEHPDTPEEEMRYKGAPVPIDPSSAKEQLSPKGPKITGAEFARAKKIFFERCAGCHGVLRKGATGKPLTPDITLPKGTEYLKAFIGYGSPGGMPNFGTSGELSEKDVDLMARYLQHEPPVPPEFGMKEIKNTWKVIIPEIGRAHV